MIEASSLLNTIFGWQPYFGNIQGSRIDGDDSMPRTSAWNKNFLRLFRWTKVAVFYLEGGAQKGFQLGFKEESGKQFIRLKVCEENYFLVRIGREPVIFFAVTLTGKEVPLEFIKVTHKNDESFLQLRLL